MHYFINFENTINIQFRIRQVYSGNHHKRTNMTCKDSIFSVIKFHYYFLKACGFFSLTITLTESKKFVLTTTWKDYTLLFISFWLHFLTAKIGYASKDFSLFADSRIIQAGLSLSRFTSFINNNLIIIMRFVNRKKIARIVMKVFLVDKRVRNKYMSLLKAKILVTVTKLGSTNTSQATSSPWRSLFDSKYDCSFLLHFIFNCN